MTALEREYRYLILRARRQNDRDLIDKLVLDAMKHDIDLSDL